jgi:hypothetical protein
VNNVGASFSTPYSSAKAGAATAATANEAAKTDATVQRRSSSAADGDANNRVVGWILDDDDAEKEDATEKIPLKAAIKYKRRIVMYAVYLVRYCV